MSNLGRDFSPVPKPESRIIDEDVLDEARQRDCEYCGDRREKWLWAGGIHPHHIVTKGSGGDDSEDNVTSLCPSGHQRAHHGEISKAELFGIVDRRDADG